jgi:hypothetical protein
MMMATTTRHAAARAILMGVVKLNIRVSSLALRTISSEFSVLYPDSEVQSTP